MKRTLWPLLFLAVCASGIAEEKANAERTLQEMVEEGRARALAAAGRGDYSWRALPSGPWWEEFGEVLKRRGIRHEMPDWCGTGRIDPKDFPEKMRLEMEKSDARSSSFEETMRSEVIKKFGADIVQRANNEAQAMYEAKQKGRSGTPSPTPVEKRAAPPAPATPPSKTNPQTPPPPRRSKPGGSGR